MNFFAPVKKISEKRVHSYVPEEDIVTFVRKEKLVKVNVDEKGNIDQDDFLIEEEYVVDECVNRADYINSFREDVGIANILKKIALSGDVTLANQVKRIPLPLDEDGKEIVQDITPLQEGEENVAKIGDNMRKTFADLPDELKAGRTLEQFLEGVSQAEIDAFVASYVAQKGENK